MFVRFQRKTLFSGLKSFLAVAAAMTLIILPVSKVLAVDPPAANLINNPSVDADTTNWTGSTNTSYVTDAHTGSHALQAQIAAPYTSGTTALWTPTPINVTAGQQYQFSVWYKSDVATEAGADFFDAAGNYIQNSYVELKYGIAASSDWTQLIVTFTVPAGAAQVQPYQFLANAGTLTTDDYSLTPYTPVGFTHPIVSVTLDDGWANQYTNARQVLNSNAIPATYYIISRNMDPATSWGSDYMTAAQVQQLYSEGNEIGAHTVDHCDLALLSQGSVRSDDDDACKTATVDGEMGNSKTTLSNLINGPVTDFAYPYGSYNATTIAAGQTAGYVSQRSVDPGYNTEDNLDLTKLKIQEVDTTTTNAQVQAWIDGAKAENAWLILVYHEVGNKAAEGDDGYNVHVDPAGDPNAGTANASDFTTQMQYLKNSGIQTETVTQAIADINSQTVTPPADTTPPVISSVASASVTSDSATISWTTDEASTSQVNYGADATYGSSTPEDSALVTSHSVTLTGLLAGTAYHFQVTSKDAASNPAASADLTFTTLPVTAVKPGDVNGDNAVDALDLSTVLSNWSLTGATKAQGDLNGDGAVDALDLSTVLTNWSI